MLAAGAGQTTLFAMFVGCVTDPVHLRVVTNRIAERIDADHFVELKCGILTDPVGVEDAQRFGHTLAHATLGDRLQISDWFQLVHTMVSRLARRAATVHWWWKEAISLKIKFESLCG